MYYHNVSNIKSIQQTKLQKMATNLFFGSLDHSKMHFGDIWMILHDLVMLSNAGKRLVLLHYAISSRSNRPKSRKWPKNSFLALWIIQKCNWWHLNDPSWSGNVAECWKTFSTIIIYNIKSIGGTKLEKMAKTCFMHN